MRSTINVTVSIGEDDETIGTITVCAGHPGEALNCAMNAAHAFMLTHPATGTREKDTTDYGKFLRELQGEE